MKMMMTILKPDFIISFNLLAFKLWICIDDHLDIEAKINEVIKSAICNPLSLSLMT